MNILLIDDALPHSFYTGKSERLRNIYGRLAAEMKIVFLRTSQVGQARESEELELWAKRAFEQTLRMPPLAAPRWTSRLLAALRNRPAEAAGRRHSMSDTFHHLYRIAAFYDIQLVVTLDLPAAAHGLLLSGQIPWIQDLGASSRLPAVLAEAARRGRLGASRLASEIRLAREMAERAAATLAASPGDAAVFGPRASLRLDFLGEGVDSDYFDPAVCPGPNGAPDFLLFFGYMGSPANQDAAVVFAERVFPAVRSLFPRLGAKIVGADPPRAVMKLANLPGVEVTGAVPDVRPFLAGASAVVLPVATHGTGASRRVLQSLAMKRPVFCSPLAAAGLRDLPPGTVFTSTSPGRMAQAIVQHLRFGVFAAAESGRDYVKQQHAWEPVIDRTRHFFRNTALRVKT